MTNSSEQENLDLERRPLLKGLVAAGLLGGSATNLGSVAADVPDDSIVNVGAGSYTTEIPSGFDYAEPLTSGDVFTTDGEEPPLPSNDWWSGLHLGYNPYDDYTYPHSNGATVALPYYSFPSDLGLSVQIPDTWKGEYLDQQLGGSKLAKMDNDVIPRLFIGHTEQTSYADVRVDGYGDWNVHARWGDGTATSMDMTLVRGSPFIFVEYEGGGAQIELYEYFQGDGQGNDQAGQLEESRIDVFAQQGNVLGITLHPDEDNGDLVDQPKSVQHFGLYAPASATWDGVGTATVSSQLAGQDYLTVAVLPDDDPATLEEFGNYAYNFVRDTTVDWTYHETDDSGEPLSEVETTFSFDIEEKPESAASGTLAGLFPHQWKHSDAPLTGIEFWSSKGTMKLFAGDQFTTTLRYPGILPHMPDTGTGDDAQLEQFVDNLLDDYDPYEAQGVPNEAYWSGKDLMRNSAAIPIAEQLDRDDAVQFFLDAVQKRLECFFDVETNEWTVDGQTYSTQEGQEVTYYHDDLGIFQTYPGGEFGAVEAINDHHLQFGYFIYVASEVARQNPEWAQEDQYGGIVELMIREYANWERPDKSAPQDPSQSPKDAFPFLRTFSPYIGHSYAGGIQGNDWGANQESASEAVASYAAMIRWGEITDNEELRDAGVYLYTHEIHGMWEYWFDQDDDSVPDDLATDVEPPGWRMALPGGELDYSPMAWDVGYWRHVYWNMADAIELYGINWIPTGGHSFFLGMNQDYTQTNWNNMVDARRHLADANDDIDLPDAEADFMDGWQQAAVVYRSMFDPDGAVGLLDTELPMAPTGNSSAFVYQFAHAMSGLGTPDHTVVADAPFYQVFSDGGERTYVAYNASDSPTDVNFSDGYTLTVPANSMATSNDDVDPIDPASFDVSGLSPQDTTIAQGEAVTVSATVANTGDAEGTQTVEYRVDGSVLASQSVSLGGGGSTTVEFAAVDTESVGAETHTHGVYSADDSATGTLTVESLSPANFAVSGLSPSSTTIQQGDPLSASADVANDGDVEATQTVELRADGIVLASQSVTLASGASTTVEFSDADTAEVGAGEYTYGVYSADGSATGTLTVDGGTDTTPPTAPSNLSTTGTTTSSVSIDWDAASDSGGSGLLNYNVYVDGSVAQTTGVGTTSATLTGLDAGTEYEIYVTAEDGAANESVESNTVRTSTDSDGGAGGEVVTAINCAGDAYTAADGTQFVADQYNSGGGELSVSDEIAGTDDDPIYQTARESEFEYTIPIDNGTYDVTIHFAELWFSAADRRLQSVHAEGTERITEYDIVAEAGDRLTAVQETFTVDVTDEELTLFFEAVQDQAHVAAIEVANPDDSGGGGGEPDLPQSVSAVDYVDSQGDFGTEPNGDGGESIGWIDAGDWWEYQSVVDGSGTADIAVNVSSPYDGTTFHVEVDGTDVSGTVTVPNTGGWQEWTDVVAASGVELDSTSTVRIVAETGSWNLNAFTLE